MRRVLLILAIAFTVGASAADFSRTPAVASSSQDPCSARVTRAVVGRLVAAINEGDINAADKLVAKGDPFLWYSVGSERIGQAARDRGTLKDYLAARRAQGERFSVLRWRYQRVGRSPVRGQLRRHAGFSMVFVRTARDYPSARVLGKGAIDCGLRPPQVAVWSLGPGTPLPSRFCSRQSLTASSPSRPLREACLVARTS